MRAKWVEINLSGCRIISYVLKCTAHALTFIEDALRCISIGYNQIESILERQKLYDIKLNVYDNNLKDFDSVGKKEIVEIMK